MILWVWALVALWVFSQYIYRFHHDESYGILDAIEYGRGFVRYMVIPWLVTVGLVLIGYIIGRWTLGFTVRDIKFSSHLEESIFAMGVGAGLIAVLTFILGVMHLLHPVLFGIIGLLILSAGYRHLIHLYRVCIDGLKPRDWTLLDWLLLLLLAAFVLSVFLRPNNPSYGGDPMNSHLAAPKFYLRDHAVIFYPWINFNNFPLLQEMLLTVQMMVLRDPGCSLIYLYMIGTVALCWVIGARWFNRSTGLIAGIFFLMMPEIYRDSQAAYVEHVLIFYSVLTLAAFLKWYESRDSRWLVLLGISAGLMCGVKYTGLIVILIALIMIIIARWLPAEASHEKPDARAMTRNIGLVVLWTAIIASPWYLRNIIFFGNPFFPFYESIFGWMQLGTLNELRSELVVDHAAMLKYFRFEPTVHNLAALPWNTTFHHNHPNTYYVPAKVGPFLLAFTPAVIFVRKWRRTGLMLIIFLAVFYAYWFLLERIEYQRYLVSAYPIHCIIAAWGLSDLFTFEAFNQSNRKHLAWVMLAISFAFMFYVKSTTKYAFSGRQLVFAGEEARQAYLDFRFPEWELIEMVNDFIGKDSPLFSEDTRIYGMANQTRRYYLDCPLIGNPWAYAGYFDFMEHAHTGAQLFQWLDDYGCEYLLYSESGAEVMAYILDIRLPEDRTFPLYFEQVMSGEDWSFWRLIGPGGVRAGPAVSGPTGIPEEVEEALPLVGEPPESLEETPATLDEPF